MVNQGPSQEQVDALREYAAENGRAWKSKLNHEWMTGQQSGILQQIRNQFGPSWLIRFKLPPVKTRETEAGKLYVIRSTRGMFLTGTSGKKTGYYWGLYIGTEGKRYGAVRWKGGDDLNRTLAKHEDWEAVEVKQ